MTPLELYRLRRKVNGKSRELFDTAVESCKPIPSIEMYRIANTLQGESEQFIEFCRVFFLVRPTRFTDRYFPNPPHSVAPKHGKLDPIDAFRAQEKALNAVLRATRLDKRD